MIPRRLAALGFLITALARTGEAQRAGELRMELGGAVVSQPGFESANAALLGVLWRRPTDRWTLLTSGNLTYANDSLNAAQGVAVADLPWRLHERLRTEIGVAAATFSLQSTGRGGNANVFARQHYVGDDRGVFAGFGSGRTSRDETSSAAWSLDAGAWQRIGMLYVSAGLVRYGSSDFPLLLTSGGFVVGSASRYALLDKLVTLQVRNGPHDFTLNFIARDGLNDTRMTARTLTASGTLQLTERFAILASGGRQLADPLRGLPQADLLTFSGRISFGRAPLPVMQRSLIAEAAVIAFTGGGGELVVRVLAVESMHVEVAGDFTDWQPIPLAREGSFWIARAQLGPGKHRVAVRVGDGPWRAPRNLARVRDDFGGEAGIVVIP